MGLLDKLMNKPQTDEAAAEAPATTESPSCLHTALLPRWDSVDDMGHEDRATGYRCDACGAEFTPDEARELRESEADRLRMHTENPPLS